MISVIITTYKRKPEVVQRAIASVMNQTYQDIEIIVVDDSPSDYEFRDGVKAVVESYANTINIQYIRHVKNMGACAARNTGLSQALGEFVAYLDDDDEWMEEKLEKQLKVFESGSENLALVYCGYSIINDLNGEVSVNRTEYHSGAVFISLLRCNFIGGTSMPLLRKAAIESVGGFDVNQPAAQDYELWLRVAREFEVGFVSEPLVQYHMQPGQCISTNYKNRIIGLNRIHEKYGEIINTNPDLMYTCNMRMVRDYSCDKQFREAMRIWARCVLIKPEKLYLNGRFLAVIIRNCFFLKGRYY